MERWIDTIKKCFAIDEPLIGISHSDVDFEILDGADQSEVIRVLGGNGATAFSWQSNGADYLFAVGKVTVSDPYDQESAVDELFGRLYGQNCEADIFSMREVMIDDMQGIEICGIADGHAETVFYALYLADGGNAYFATGFSEGEAEIVFDEFSGASRTFYRKPAPAVVTSGKNTSPVFSALRALAARTSPDESSPHIIRNTSFDVEEGAIADEFSVVGITEGDVEQISGRDFYEGLDIVKDAGAFLAMLSNKYDIAGFTVTSFKDGRYSVTFYPVADKDLDEEHEHHEDCDHDEESTDHEVLLEESVFALASKLTTFYPQGWQRSLNFAVTCGEKGEELAFDTLVSETGAFQVLELPDTFDSVLEEELPELSELLYEHYKDLSMFLFTFEKDPATGGVDRNSISFKSFLFDDYFDGCGSSVADGIELLSEFTRILFDELNNGQPVVSASFKIARDSRGIFFVETPYMVTADEVKHIELDSAAADEILANASRVFTDDYFGDAVQFTIFPDAKIGVQGEEKDEEIRIDSDIFSDLLEEYELVPYKKELEKLLRNEISIDIYEASEEDMVEIGASKAGGSPDLAMGEKWPSDSGGAPMAFIAQMNLCEVAAFDTANELPKTGRLAFFFNESSGECKVLYNNSKELKRISFIEALERGDILPTGIDEVLQEFLPARFRLGGSLSLPIMVDGETTPPFLPEEMEDAYQDIAWLNDRVKMLGYPFIQSDETELSLNKNMKLLFQITSLHECGMNWGDGGTMYFWISSDDLKKQRFDNCICEIQSFTEDNEEPGSEE